VAAAYSHTRYNATASIGNYNHANVGASWNLGFARLFALYNVVRADVLGGPVKKNTWEIGAHIPVGPVGKVRLTYLRLDDRSAGTLLNADGTARSGNDARQWGVGYLHDMSKRTALYGSYARITNKGQAAYTVSGGPAPLGGGASSGVEVGLRHLF
jgi:predicted porin